MNHNKRTHLTFFDEFRLKFQAFWYCNYFHGLLVEWNLWFVKCKMSKPEDVTVHPLQTSENDSEGTASSQSLNGLPLELQSPDNAVPELSTTTTSDILRPSTTVTPTGLHTTSATTTTSTTSTTTTTPVALTVPTVIFSTEPNVELCDNGLPDIGLLDTELSDVQLPDNSLPYNQPRLQPLPYELIPSCPQYDELYPPTSKYNCNFKILGFLTKIEIEKQASVATEAGLPSVVRFRGKDYNYPAMVGRMELTAIFKALSVINFFSVLYLLAVLTNSRVDYLNILVLNALFLLISAVIFANTAFSKRKNNLENDPVISFTWIFISLAFTIHNVLSDKSSLTFNIILLIFHVSNYIYITNVSSYTNVKYCWLSKPSVIDSTTYFTPLDQDYFYWHEIFSFKGLGIREKLNIHGYSNCFMNIAFVGVSGLYYGRNIEYKASFNDVVFGIWSVLAINCMSELRTYTYQDTTRFKYSMLYIAVFQFIPIITSRSIDVALPALVPLFIAMVIAWQNIVFYAMLARFYELTTNQYEMATFNVPAAAYGTMNNITRSNNTNSGDR
ncbi:unnamed protein product [Bursaphelenchus okinawaensis]|uniref:Uncharacterized protein n=1 Tax=Bursaphelenchus okinawaensis TaxID=465554 RepID=A0A811KPB4_9BILA|nr:unnamed protein product [Bursaphelenchus okinawaensis]CAG9107229.1 unnamed protein product [Bursaphelenchus okinawaensis]